MRFLSTLAEVMPDQHKWRLGLRELGKHVIGAFEHKFRGSFESLRSIQQPDFKSICVDRDLRRCSTIETRAKARSTRLL